MKDKRLTNNSKKFSKALDFKSLNYDSITGLPNSSYLKEYLEEKLSLDKGSSLNLCLLIVDIDDFKYINDALGYDLANKLIVQISNRLHSFCGDSRFLSRHYGVQFALVADCENETSSHYELVEDVFKLFSKSFLLEGHEIDINATIGASSYHDSIACPEDLIRQAHSAMRSAKLSGKNDFCLYNSRIESPNLKHFELKNDFRKAIQTNQFEVYYQPVINLKQGEMISAEALIRWKHPRFGLVSPAEFIPIAESTGLIIELGDWVLRDVCKTYLEWSVKGFKPIKVAINISSIQFLEKQFVDKAISTMRDFGVCPSNFILEITESAFIKNSSKVKDDIKKLQDFGVKIALDDFGTGFSSLMSLSRFNIDILKTDRFFIDDLSTRTSNTIIFESVINLAKNLNIDLVVEGIETREQHNHVLDLGGSTAQGYLFSRPVPSTYFEKHLREPFFIK